MRIAPSAFAIEVAAPVSTLIYRSRATCPLAAAELLTLTRAAQARNQAEAITGLVVYDQGRFFQWLEGPEAGLARVMRSIDADNRHTDIAVLTRSTATRRRFDGWHMKLGLPGSAATPWSREVLAPPMSALAALRRQPNSAARVLGSLASVRLRSEVKTFVHAAVIARLAHPNATPARARRLADLLLSDDVDAVAAFLDRDPTSRTTLLEPAARHLGDRWLIDELMEAEVTLALCTLQSALRRLHHPDPTEELNARSALVTPHPGEWHGLGASLSAHALRASGWAVRPEFPATDGALAGFLEAEWFDLLDLSLSAALTRSDRLDALAASIRMARAASRNPALIVAVGGRAFAGDAGLVARVGADRRAGDHEAAGERSAPSPLAKASRYGIISASTAAAFHASI